MLEDIHFISQETKTKSVEKLISNNGIFNINISEPDNVDDEEIDDEDFPIPQVG